MRLMAVNRREYTVLRLLGKGKGGYSYLVTDGTRELVLKQIHHEPCAYYSFGDKLGSELRDYTRLARAGIRIPQMVEVDRERERVLKEYIPGPTVFDLVRGEKMEEAYLDQVREMARQAKEHGLNIDYFPTNFVARDGLLWYIDYECNEYMEQWDFDHWGIAYWSRTPEFLEYVKNWEKEKNSPGKSVAISGEIPYNEAKLEG